MQMSWTEKEGLLASEESKMMICVMGNPNGIREMEIVRFLKGEGERPEGRGEEEGEGGMVLQRILSVSSGDCSGGSLWNLGPFIGKLLNHRGIKTLAKVLD